MELSRSPPGFLSKDNSCSIGSIIWQTKEKMALYFRPGGPVVAGIGTSGFMGGINLYHDKQYSRERGRHRFLWEQYYGARWQYAIKCKFIYTLTWLLLPPFLVENEHAFLRCSHLEENIYISPIFFEVKASICL